MVAKILLSNVSKFFCQMYQRSKQFRGVALGALREAFVNVTA